MLWLTIISTSGSVGSRRSAEHVPGRTVGLWKRGYRNVSISSSDTRAHGAFFGVNVPSKNGR